MILRCIRWYPQRIKPQKLWKWCRYEYPSREVGFSQEILPRVKNRAHDESAWFTWQGVHLMSFHELNPTQQPQNLTNSRSSKMVNRGKKEGKNQIQIILDQRLRSQRAWLLYFHDLPGLVVLQRITYRKLKHRHSINLEMRAGDMGKKSGADPCTQPPCRPILDISNVSQNGHHTVRVVGKRPTKVDPPKF